jgi:hypothetical protein
MSRSNDARRSHLSFGGRSTRPIDAADRRDRSTRPIDATDRRDRATRPGDATGRRDRARVADSPHPSRESKAPEIADEEKAATNISRPSRTPEANPSAIDGRFARRYCAHVTPTPCVALNVADGEQPPSTT